MDFSDPVLRRLKLSDLRLMQEVVQRGSMARAATFLHISQPAVSKAIAALEQTLGVRLLDRTSTGVQPTIYGQALLRGGIAVFDELQQSVKQIRFMTDPTAGDLRIGCNQPLAVGLVSVVIEQLKQKHPGIRVYLVEADAVTLKQHQLRQRNVELLVIRTPVPCPEPDMVAEPLFDDQLFVTVAANSHWASRRRLSLTDLKDVHWAIPPLDSVVAVLIRESFANSNLEPPVPSVSTASMHVLFNLLATGRYVGIMPGSMLRFAAKRLGLKALPIRLRHSPSPAAIVTLKHRTISPLSELFIETARELAKPFAGGA